MDYLFYQVAAINGFDSYGHYLRAGLILNALLAVRDRELAPTACRRSATTAPAAAHARRAPSSVPGYADTRRSASLRQLDAYFHGKTLQLPTQSAPKDGAAPKATASTAPPAPAPLASATAPPAASQAQGSDPSQSLLDYLLGSDG